MSDSEKNEDYIINDELIFPKATVDPKLIQLQKK